MAYISQEKKKQIAPAIKSVLKKYGMKGTIAVDHHSSLVVNLKSGQLDLMGAAQKYNDYCAEFRGEQQRNVGGNMQVNTSWVEEWMNRIGETKIANFYSELIDAMKSGGWYNNSDIMTDYFDIAYYTDINVGRWDRDYVLDTK
jgi:hypothetical protein